MRCVISVLGKDRAGIVAGISGVLAEKGASIDDINQTILDSIFSMTMLVRLDTDTAGFNEVQEALAKEGERAGRSGNCSARRRIPVHVQNLNRRRSSVSENCQTSAGETQQGTSCAPLAGETFAAFVDTIAALRAPNGCPWDREQTHESIARNMIEEAYEAVDAIEQHDAMHLREELGDVLAGGSQEPDRRRCGRIYRGGCVP